MKVTAIIQARMGSSRLPGKVLLDLAGAPVLSRVVRRTARAATIGAIVVATTTKEEDRPIVELCGAQGWPCFRGSELDLLDRYHAAAQAHAADPVVRITSDCPLIDPEIIDSVVGEFLGDPAIDYVSNSLFPVGLSVEVMNFASLERAWRQDRNPAWREHVTPYIYRNPDLFRFHTVANDQDHSGFRWTLDTPEDFDLISNIYRRFGHDLFTWREALALVRQYPEWMELNRHVEQKKVD